MSFGQGPIEMIPDNHRYIFEPYTVFRPRVSTRRSNCFEYSIVEKFVSDSLELKSLKDMIIYMIFHHQIQTGFETVQYGFRVVRMFRN